MTESGMWATFWKVICSSHPGQVFKAPGSIDSAGRDQRKLTVCATGHEDAPSADERRDRAALELPAGKRSVARFGPETSGIYRPLQAGIKDRDVGGRPDS